MHTGSTRPWVQLPTTLPSTAKFSSLTSLPQPPQVQHCATPCLLKYQPQLLTMDNPQSTKVPASIATTGGPSDAAPISLTFRTHGPPYLRNTFSRRNPQSRFTLERTYPSSPKVSRKKCLIGKYTLTLTSSSHSVILGVTRNRARPKHLTNSCCSPNWASFSMATRKNTLSTMGKLLHCLYGSRLYGSHGLEWPSHRPHVRIFQCYTQSYSVAES